jgi:hypothetical protein
MSKRQKTNSTYNCSLFAIKLSDEDSVLIGTDRVWVWGLLAYCTKFDTWNTFLITQEAKDEARQKSHSLASTPLAKAVQECFSLLPIGSFEPFANIHPSLSKQQFWVRSLETCILTKFLECVSLDSVSGCTIQSLIEVYYQGFTYTFSWNPVLAIQILDAFRDRFDNEIHGENFLTFNPVLLVQVYLWATHLSTTFSSYIKKFHPSRHIPLSVEVLQAANPMQGLKPVEEQSVGDQDMACAVAFGASPYAPVLMNMVTYMHTYSYAPQDFQIEW